MKISTILIILITLTTLTGCTVIAYKGDEKMVLRGFGAKSATFQDGSKIEKSEPVRVPSLGGLKYD